MSHYAEAEVQTANMRFCISRAACLWQQMCRCCLEQLASLQCTPSCATLQQQQQPGPINACVTSRLTAFTCKCQPIAGRRHTMSVSSAVDGSGGGVAASQDAAGRPGAQAWIGPPPPVAGRLPASVASSQRAHPAAVHRPTQCRHLPDNTCCLRLYLQPTAVQAGGIPRSLKQPLHRKAPMR